MYFISSYILALTKLNYLLQLIPDLKLWLTVSKRTVVAEYRRQSEYLLKQVPGLTQSILAACSKSSRRRTTNDRYSGLDPYWPDRRLAFLTVASDPNACFVKTLHCSGVHLSTSASCPFLWVSYSTLSHSTMAETHARENEELSLWLKYFEMHHRIVILNTFTNMSMQL